MNYQKIVLLGEIITKPKYKVSDEDIKYDRMTFDVAVTYIANDRVVFPVVVMGMLADMIDKQAAEGKQILIEGRMEMDKAGKMSVLADWVQLENLFAVQEKKEKLLF